MHPMVGVIQLSFKPGVTDLIAIANIDEFITMLAGGLAGATPHMISATITAISRVLFEFKGTPFLSSLHLTHLTPLPDTISPKMHDELLQTLLVFLASANREIVKSAIGFVKLAIHTLPTETLRPHLPSLVVTLLGWSHDHKNHFKVKVRHIFERMLRRFSFEEVYACAADQEAGKVLLNIKKRKDRAKRKKAARAEEGDEDEDAEEGGARVTKAITGDAFEDVLYGSESELGDSDDENEGERPQAGRAKGKKGPAGAQVRIRMDDDEPMDLLHNVSSKVTSALFIPTCSVRFHLLMELKVRRMTGVASPGRKPRISRPTKKLGA